MCVTILGLNYMRAICVSTLYFGWATATKSIFVVYFWCVSFSCSSLEVLSLFFPIAFLQFRVQHAKTLNGKCWLSLSLCVCIWLGLEAEPLVSLAKNSHMKCQRDGKIGQSGIDRAKKVRGDRNKCEMERRLAKNKWERQKDRERERGGKIVRCKNAQRRQKQNCIVNADDDGTILSERDEWRATTPTTAQTINRMSTSENGLRAAPKSNHCKTRPLEITCHQFTNTRAHANQKQTRWAMPRVCVWACISFDRLRP